MLTRPGRSAATVVVTFVLLTFAVTLPAFADPWGEVDCDNNPSAPGCNISAGDPGTPAGGDGSGAEPAAPTECKDPGGAVIPCERNGGWAGGDGCYYKAIDLSSEVSDRLGHPSGSGGWYVRTCYIPGGGERAMGQPVWLASPPSVSPEALARRALARLTLPKVSIAVSPKGDQLVGLPSWLWLEGGSWSTQSATARVPGLSITATATPASASWDMGDGQTVVCKGPGTPWGNGADTKAASPDCGYTYNRSSAAQPGETYTVTVTVAWSVAWSGGSSSGTLPDLTTSASTQLRVAESQAVVTN